MGLFKILGCAALGVGAIAAAPFTGGGSVLGAASLVASLTGAGAAATAAGVAGGVAGAAWSDSSEESRRAERKEAHEFGFKQGVKKGNIETAEKFLAMLEANEDYRIGIFALAVYVANKDNDFTEEEKSAIERYLGRPDSLVNKNIRDKFKDIYENIPSFNNLKHEYLNEIVNSDLEELTGFVMMIIEADGIISHAEQQFLSYEWEPYLKERGIA